MAKVTLKGNPVETVGSLPEVGTKAAEFTLVQSDLSEVSLKKFEGRRLVLNVFPSIDTDTCANSVRKFNLKVTELDNTAVLCVSKDLPFAHARFCGAEGIENVSTGSAFRSSFGEDYGLIFTSGPLKGLLSRAVVVINETGEVIYTEQVQEVADEPDYDAALAVL